MDSREILDYARALAMAARQRAAYRAADPYPHVTIDDFLHPAAAERALDEFPSPATPGWIHWAHLNESKIGKSDRQMFPPAIGAIVDELRSPRFIEFLTALTGIQGLFPDDTLQGGGIHQTVRGGFLNVHADFSVHPHHVDWQRRVNVLVYLNKHWRDEYGGHLELWDRSMRRCVRRVAPEFNRCVIFNTDCDSYHGHPDPLAVPDGLTRKSLALYYFSLAPHATVRATAYRPRPQDSPMRRLGIHLDALALGAYDAARRRFKFDDRVVSRVLGWFARTRK
jgi:2OG-Fe(II) oxygenase superfamily